MTGLRDARAAVLTRWHRDLADDFTRALPLLLDDLERIDREQVPDGVITAPAELSEEELTELRERWHAIWEQEQAEAATSKPPLSPAAEEPREPAAQAKPARTPARRRPARKAAGS